MKRILFSLTLSVVSLLTNGQNYNWAFRLGGTGVNESSNSIAADNAGNIYVAGSFEGTVDFDPSSTINYFLTSGGNKDIFFAKYTPSGALVWAYRMGSTGIDEAVSIKVNQFTNDVYLAGTFQNVVDFNPAAATATLSAAGGFDIFFAKYTSAGGLTYARRIGTTSSESILDMDVNSNSSGNGEFTIVGRFSNTVDFDPNAGAVNLTAVGSELFVARYSSTFTYMNVFKLNSSSVTGTKVKYDANYSAIYLTGNFNGTVDFDPSVSTNTLASVTSSLVDAYVAKYNTSSLGYVWAKRLGGAFGVREGTALVVDGNNDVIVAGYNSGEIDLDPSASVATFTTNGSYDIFLGKYAGSTGNYILGNSFGGTATEYVTSLGVDPTNNIYMSGSFGNKVDFDPVNPDTLVSVGSDDIYFTKFTTTGNYVFSKSMGNANPQGTRELVVTGSDNLYLIGNTNGLSCDFDPSVTGVANISSLGGSDGFVAKYKNCPDPLPPFIGASINNPCIGSTVTFTSSGGFLGGGATWNWYSGTCGGTPEGTGVSIVVTPTVTASYYVRAEGGCLSGPGVCSGANLITVQTCTGLDELQNNNLIQIFPNPFKDKIYFVTDKRISSIEIYDATGKLLIQESDVSEIDLSNISSGLLIVKTKLEDGHINMKKLVKE